jgi:Arc/MetJ family transcription regulator
MRTNIVLDDELVGEAFRYAGVETKRELVELALRELVENRRRMDVRELRGTVRMDPDYEYAALREGRESGGKGEEG